MSVVKQKETDMEVATMRAQAHGWAERARDLGSETRGFVKVDPAGVWAYASSDGPVEIICGRDPSPAERRAASEEAIGKVVLRSASDIAPRRAPDSDAAKRVRKLFGGAL